MRLTRTALLLTLCLALSPAACPALAQAIDPVNDEDRAVFKQLFEEKLDFTRRSRNTDDNRALAVEMMDLAITLPDSPGVQCLLYIESVPLAADAEDLELMMDASSRLGWLWPGHEATDAYYLVGLAGKAFDNASRDQRGKIAEAYIDLSLAATEKAEREDDIDKALSYCRQSNTAARAYSSKRRDEIEDILDRLSAINSLISRIEILAHSVRKNPRNRPAAQELVDLLVIRRDKPIQAAEFAPMTQDPELIDLLGICKRGVDAATGPEALRVGDWYFGLGGHEDDHVAQPLLKRARAWYGRFLSVYPRQDALAKRVRAMDSAAAEKLSAFNKAQQVTTKGDWVNLIKTKFDPEVHTIGKEGSVQLRNNEIVAERASIIMPVTPGKAYELRIKMMVLRGEEDAAAFLLYMPVADDSAACIRVFWEGRRASRIDGPEEYENYGWSDDRFNRVGKQIELVFQTAELPTGQIGIALLMDGKEAMRWVGNTAELEIPEFLPPPEEMGRVFRFSCPSRVLFRSIELRERDGQ